MDPVDLSPAPGRTPVPLGRGWTAVLLEPLPGAGVLFVGIFLAGKLVLLLEEPGEVRGLLRLLGAHRRLAGQPPAWAAMRPQPKSNS